mmetsp:Transcript_33435/g.113530  ORF Transcript_33435/g.113530 Transcript_33435/m.113530 type:complete len:218 (+) Transcript_33435:339-992(+)
MSSRNPSPFLYACNLRAMTWTRRCQASTTSSSALRAGDVGLPRPCSPLSFARRTSRAGSETSAGNLSACSPRSRASRMTTEQRVACVSRRPQSARLMTSDQVEAVAEPSPPGIRGSTSPVGPRRAVNTNFPSCFTLRRIGSTRQSLTVTVPPSTSRATAHAYTLTRSTTSAASSKRTSNWPRRNEMPSRGDSPEPMGFADWSSSTATAPRENSSTSM